MTLRRPWSLRTHLLLPILGVALLPLAALTLAGYSVGSRAVEAEVEARNLQLASAISAEVKRFLDDERHELRDVARAVDRALKSERRLAESIEVRKGERAALTAVLVLSPEGRVLAASPEDPDSIGIDLSRLPFVVEARRTGKETWSYATFALDSGEPRVALVIPDSRFMVVGYVDLSSIVSIPSRYEPSNTREVAIVGRDGTVIAHPDPSLAREHVVLELPPVKRALLGEEATAEYEFRGRGFLGSAAQIPETQWVVLVSEPVESAYAQVRRMKQFSLLGIVLAGGGMATFAVFFLARLLARPFEVLSEGARRVAAGEYQGAVSSLKLRGPREIMQLAQSFVTMAQEVGAREAALASSERDLRAIVDNAIVGLVRTRADGTILSYNAAAGRMLAVSDPAQVAVRRASDFYADPSVREEVVKTLKETGRVRDKEVRMRALDGTERTFLLNLHYAGETLTTVLVDLTELKRGAEEKRRLEQQLMHAQKMEAVGRLAGGVAHDFNNLLTAIVGYAEILKDVITADHPERENLDGILMSAKRASHLTQSLLAYSRKQILRPRPVDLNEVIAAVEKLLGRLIGEDVLLKVTLPKEPMVVVADPGQIEQVLLNLATNARDAMPQGGTLTLGVEPVEVTPQKASELGLRGGAFARITVADTGQGISESVRAQIFEPFFTTKPAGKGTGLGLSIVDGIVRQHGGHVSVKSSPGQGTTFTILLERNQAKKQDAQPTFVRGGPGGHETILLAEDEPLVRKVFRRTLERAGYSVVEAEDGEEALEIFAASPDRFGLCLLDVVMPRRNGRETAAALTAQRPNLPILLASGYTADALADRGQLTGDVEIIAKPVEPAELLSKVREMLDRALPSVPAA